MSKDANAITIGDEILHCNIADGKDSKILYVANKGVFYPSDANLSYDLESSEWTINNGTESLLKFAFVKLNKVDSVDLFTHLSGSMPVSPETFDKLESYSLEYGLVSERNTPDLDNGIITIDVGAIDELSKIIGEIANIIGDELTSPTLFKRDALNFADITFYC